MYGIKNQTYSRASQCLSVTTFLQEQMMTIPDPVANIACAEETTLVLIITQSWSERSGHARRSHQVQSTKSPAKKSEPQASNSSMGAQGSAPR